MCLVGNITHNLELKTTNNGLAVCNFSLAVDKAKKDGTKEANFISCVAFDRQAENLVKYADKGRRIGVVGSWNVDTWEANGEKKRRDYCYVNHWEYADSKPKEQKFVPADDDDLPWH